MPDNVKEYIEFLERIQRNHKEYTLWQLHQNYISREVAREYGLTKEQILQLDEDL